jgi:signal transduction histidine kinase
MVYANVTPVDATVSTLKTQLWYVALIIAALMVAVTVYMTKFIARPLNRITAAAKTLPEGRYEEATGTNEYAEAQDLNQTLAQAAVDIQKADKAKRDLIGNVSHDLRTPLTMISGYAELMQDFPDQNNQENLQTIIDESHRLTVLVNDLLDLSKLQGSQIELKYSDFDLDRMLQDELRKYEVYVAKEGFQITYQGCEGLQVHADEERIKQVFNNFMTNAINYSGKARQIEVRLSREGQMAHVEVQDHGEGIPEDKLKDIWDRYYKVDTTHVRAVQGSGIGLSIVKEILSLHQVPYGVRSKVNEGSTFWFELPLTGQKEAGSK